MNRFRLSLIKHLLTLWLVGLATFALATWICFELDVNSATVGFVYLTIVVVLSLWDSFLSSAIFCAFAVLLLNYYFIEPIFSFQITYARDIPMLGTFCLTSFVITGLVRRIQKSVETLKRQAQLLDLTHDTVVARDSQDAITFWNHGAEQLYGWTRDEALGKNSPTLLKTVFPESRETIDDLLRRSGHWEGELVNTRKDGTPVTVASRWSMQRDDGGHPVGTLETNNDITERRRAEDALRRSQAAYLAEAQKLSLTGSFGWDAASGNVFWSEQSYVIFGCEPTIDPSIELMLERVHPGDVEAVRRTFDRASTSQAPDSQAPHSRTSASRAPDSQASASRTSGDQSEFDIEFRLLMPDGAVKHVHAVAHTMEGEPGKSQFVGSLMDVTAARQAEVQLHQAQAQVAHIARVTSLGALSASIAHEVNQPLAAIVSHGEASLRWLNREVPRLDEVASSIRHVIANGKRASEVIQRIRALTSKSEQKKILLNLNDVVAEVVPLVQREAASHGAFLQMDRAPDLPAILGDRIQLQQVIINLILNAVQAMATVEGRTRSVVVRSRAGGSGHVLLDVEDSGPGIDSENTAQLFEAFFTTKPAGMGMGLSICRSIVEAHGGQMQALSKPSGPGAIFRLSLPASPQT
jgi:PAS domain S-box-containing protein